MESALYFICYFFSFLTAVDYGYPWRRTTGGNISYTNWQKDNFFYAVQQQVKAGTCVVKLMALVELQS